MTKLPNKLIKEDVKIFIDRAKNNGWRVESEIDGEDEVILDIYKGKDNAGYTFWFDSDGKLKSVYSDWEFDYKEAREVSKKVLERINKFSEKLDNLSFELEEISEEFYLEEDD